MCQFNGQALWPKPSAVRVVYSDASDTGYGAIQLSMGCMWLRDNRQNGKPSTVPLGVHSDR